MSDLKPVVDNALADFARAATPAELEDAKARYLGRSGVVTEQLKALAALPAAEKKARGAEINLAKQAIDAALVARRAALADAELDRQLAAQALEHLAWAAREGWAVARADDRVVIHAGDARWRFAARRQDLARRGAIEGIERCDGVSMAALTDLVAGQIDIIVDQTSNSIGQVRAGTIRAYAVTADKRVASASDIPTTDEAGLPGFHMTLWSGLWVPKNTPKDIVTKLNAAAVEALTDPAVQKKFNDLGLDTPPKDQLTPEALGAWQKSEIAKWWPMIKAANVKVE